ncbi:hypothetical protein PInf_000574 [Phytophthora infestans]|nr:hypothetical protein PInf_000574 [Phytophthora infestans]
MLARRRSSRLDKERQAVEQQVEEAFKLKRHSDTAEAVLLRRKSSAYLPPTDDSLRVAKQMLQGVYSLQELYGRQHFIENAASSIAMIGVFLVILDIEYFIDKDAFASLILF